MERKPDWLLGFPAQIYCNSEVSELCNLSQEIYNEGLDKGIEGAVELLREAGFGDQDIIEKIMSKYHLTLEAAKKYVLLPTAG